MRAKHSETIVSLELLLFFAYTPSVFVFCFMVVSSTATLAIVIVLFGEDDDELAEDGDEVDEEVERVIDEIAIAHLKSRHDQLRIVAHVPAHDDDAPVQGHVAQAGAANEDIGDVNPEHGRKS